MPTLKHYALKYLQLLKEVAKEMIGYQLPGTIQQLKVDPYEIYDQRTGEVKVLDYQNVYMSEEGEV